jgi:hypothetical protein
LAEPPPPVDLTLGIRREAKLPLPPIAKELRRMKKQEELEELSGSRRFTGRLCGRRCSSLDEKRKAAQIGGPVGRKEYVIKPR